MLKKTFFPLPKKSLFNILKTTKYSVVQNQYTSYCIISWSAHIVYNIKIFVNKKNIKMITRIQATDYADSKSAVSPASEAVSFCLYRRQIRRYYRRCV
jgi:hypothetical protein